jgi:hypothetical protein
MATGNTYPATFDTAAGDRIRLQGEIIFTDSTNQPVQPGNPIASGTLPQLAAWVSGTEQQNTFGRPITVVVDATTDASNNAATVAIALSPDDVTFTTVGTVSVAAAINNLGAVTEVVPVLVPEAWWIKLTISAHASVATSSYY